MIKKVILILTLLLLIIGAAYAAKNVDDFKVPAEYSQKTSEGVYTVPNGDDNPMFIILKTSSTSDIDTNETGYRIYPTGETPNTYSIPWDRCR